MHQHEKSFSGDHRTNNLIT